ncbi:hypothetical protein K2Z84_33435, partial [Candidatus Binatia bacterium]|nr:hypothetical protein [Candidatus Binatia bacterium]
MTTDGTEDEPTRIEAPVRGRPRWRRWWAIALYVVVALVIGVRVALPYVLRRVIETQGETFLAGRVKVANVDLWLLRGAVAVEGVELIGDRPVVTASVPPAASAAGATPDAAPEDAATRAAAPSA